ncbi:MAG: agmatinase [Alphaproteobacteria bacterium]|nr:agmatinase [Alphaproteobacteria bacterium]
MTDPRHVALIGLPSDRNSSFLRGAAAAPAAIRAALASDAGNAAAENGREIGDGIDLRDLGDLPLDAGGDDHALIDAAVGDAMGDGRTPILLGGDHAVSWPAVAAVAKRTGPVSILHIDAHPDLYDNFGGNPASHASPFARIMERGLATRLVQVGIRTLNRHCRAQAERFGVEVVPMRRFDPEAVPIPDGPLYVSIDLDGLDPAFAPGVSHAEPGGLSTRQLLDLIHRIDRPLVGADIVELNPSRDVNGVTAILAAKLVRELASLG